MAQSMFSIGGLATGLDTTAIISQLMSIERQPIVRFQQRQAELRKVDSAWGDVVSKLSALRTAVDGVKQATSWSNFATATSSAPDAVKVTATGGAEPSSLSFTVDQLAARHQVAGSRIYTAPTELVGAGTFTINDAGGNPLTTITTTATTTLADLARDIDAANVGVDAQALKVADGQYRLVLSATDTGAAAQFSLTTGPEALDTFATTQTGTDAVVSIGTLQVSRSSNTITDLVDGVTIELAQTTTAPVTVTTSRDVTAAADAIQGLVDAANELLSTLGKHTAYNADTKTAGALQGDPLARKLAMELRQLVSDTVPGGDVNHASQVGMSLTRTGGITLDRAKLEQALADDFDAVAGFFGQSFTGPAGVTFGSSTSDTQPGTYAVQIDTAAAVAMATGSSFTPPGGQPKTFSLTTSDGTTVEIQIDTSVTSATQARAQIEAALVAASISTITVDDTGGVLTFAETRYGSQYGFTISGLGDGLDGSYNGVDVAGTIGASTTTGSGRTLRATDGDAAGLSLSYTGTDTGAIGDVSYSGGLAGLLDQYLEAAEGTGGSIQTTRDTIAGRIRNIDDRIADFEVRLELRETALRRQFAGLEATMGTLMAQGNWLASQIAGMNAAPS